MNIIIEKSSLYHSIAPIMLVIESYMVTEALPGGLNISSPTALFLLMLKQLREDCLHFRVKEVVVHSVPSLHNIPTWQSYRSIQPSFQFIINNFGKRKSLNRDSFGPALYTHQGGYKMHLNVEPCKGNYIAIYACLL